MKTICILSYPRTGSTWLCDTLGGYGSQSINEPFHPDPLQFYWILKPIIKNIGVNDVIIDIFSKIYNPSNLKINILNKDLYSINLLKCLQEFYYKYEKNLIFKIFTEHIKNFIDYDEIFKISNFIICLNRKSLVDSYISEKKAILSNRWTSLDANLYLEKIFWDPNEYNFYIDKILKKIDKIECFCKNINEEKIIKLSYEEIHSLQTNKEKIDLINKKILEKDPNFKWSYNEESIFKKENYIKNIEDNFINSEDFLKDIKKLQTNLN
jgi:hypothetical protein